MLSNRVLCNLISRRYAGHSKWANIKHIKASKDAQRSALFTKLSRQMKVAIQEGGSANPDTNLRLSHVIEQARRQCMPAATIQNVVRSTQLNKNECKVSLLELRGPQGCVVLCQVLTDNITRCRQNLSAIIKKHGVSFSDGSGRHLFEQKGVVEALLAEQQYDEDLLMEHAIDSGAEDVKPDATGERVRFICEPKLLATVRAHLEGIGYGIVDSGVEYLPKMCIPLEERHFTVLASLFEKLESQEEVIKLYDNIA